VVLVVEVTEEHQIYALKMEQSIWVVEVVEHLQVPVLVLQVDLV
jgi:hypothetical protein|tara:strand:+ start:636 stop:767 length:132 start_codon:yes stop_codon:yes gene_type:complete